MKTLSFHPRLGKFDVTTPVLICMCIEERKTFWRFNQYCYDAFPDHLAYCSYEDDQKEDKGISDVSLYIENPFHLDLNTKQNLNALYKLLKKEYFDEIRASVDEIEKILIRICGEIRLDFEAELTMEDSIKVDDVFKLGNLRFSEEDDTMLKRLLKFVLINYELRGIALVFINRLHDWLDEDEIAQLCSDAGYRGISIVTIESHEPKKYLDSEQKIVVDSDLCLL